MQNLFLVSQSNADTKTAQVAMIANITAEKNRVMAKVANLINMITQANNAGCNCAYI